MGTREDLQDALDRAYERALVDFDTATKKAFEAGFIHEPSCVAYVGYSPTPGLRYIPIHEAILDELEYIGPQARMREMLSESACPYVAEFKRALIESYISRNRAEVAEMMAGEAA